MRRHLIPTALSALLLVGGMMDLPDRESPVEPEVRVPQEAIAYVDSLRTARAFRTALARLDELLRRTPGAVEVLWRQAVLWPDLAKAAAEKTRRATTGEYSFQSLERP